MAVMAFIVNRHGIGFIALSKHKREAALIIAEIILIMGDCLTRDLSFI